MDLLTTAYLRNLIKNTYGKQLTRQAIEYFIKVHLKLDEDYYYEELGNVRRLYFRQSGIDKAISYYSFKSGGKNGN